MAKTTEIKITKQFWAIIRTGDPRGYYTGTPHLKTVLIETDTATELSEIIADGSVESGESGGDFVFHILAISQEKRILYLIVESEKQEAEQEAREKASGMLE
jgi:hypothetical protein